MKTLIFDFDGTLCDSVTVGIRLINEQAPSFGYRTIQSGEEEKFRNLTTLETIKALGIAHWKLPFLVRKLRKEIRKEMDTLLPYAGIRAALQDLKNGGFTLGILTSNSEENVLHFFQKHQFEFFDFVYSKSSLFGKHRHLRKILKSKNISKNLVAYIGDEVRDIHAAKEAGIFSIAVSWGAHSRTLLQSHSPDLIVDSTKDLHFNQINHYF